MSYLDAKELDIETNEDILYSLINFHGDELKRIAYLYLNDLAQSEDIVQEVFIACYKNLHKFKHQSSYKTWLYRITINKCKDYQKRWSYRNIIYKPDKESFETTSSHSAQTQYEMKFKQQEIIESLSKLPPKYKEVLIFYYYKEMTMKEISEVTNSKVNTIKSRLARGRQLLKRELERKGFFYE